MKTSNQILIALFTLGLTLLGAPVAAAASQLVLPFDLSAPDQDIVLYAGNGIHNAESQSQAAEVFDGRIYYAVQADGSAMPQKVRCFDPVNNHCRKTKP